MERLAAIISDYAELFVWVIVLTAAIYAIVKFMRLPTKDQVQIVKECLLNWVVAAEAEFGSGTGKVKLSDVYAKFVSAFPFIKTTISFETFSGWVDEALEQMRGMLEQNKNLREAIGVEKGDKV